MLNKKNKKLNKSKASSKIWISNNKPANSAYIYCLEFLLKRDFPKIRPFTSCLPPLFPLDVILDVVEMEVEGEVVCELRPKEDVGAICIIPWKLH